MWRTFTWRYCTNCGQDGHQAESCTSEHVHGWRLATVDSENYHCQGCPAFMPAA